MVSRVREEARPTFRTILRQFGFTAYPVHETRRDCVKGCADNHNRYAEVITYDYFVELWIGGNGIPNRSYPGGLTFFDDAEGKAKLVALLESLQEPT